MRYVDRLTPRAPKIFLGYPTAPQDARPGDVWSVNGQRHTWNGRVWLKAYR